MAEQNSNHGLIAIIAIVAIVALVGVLGTPRSLGTFGASDNAVGDAYMLFWEHTGNWGFKDCIYAKNDGTRWIYDDDGYVTHTVGINDDCPKHPPGMIGYHLVGQEIVDMADESQGKLTTG